MATPAEKLAELLEALRTLGKFVECDNQCAGNLICSVLGLHERCLSFQLTLFYT